MEDELWLGSLSLYTSYNTKVEGMSAALLSGAVSQDDSEDSSNYFSLFGNIGVVDVTGTLTNDDSWYARFFGDTSYNFFRHSLIEAATHSEVKAIVLNVDSGGGTPHGLPDAAELITQIVKLGMPVYTYTGGVMASAAYWLGSAAMKVYAAETATVGSIGVISIHKEYTQKFKNDGVKVTVLRAGEQKALTNSYEKLSDKAKETTQSHLEDLYTVFLNNVAKYRSVPADYVRENMADGQEFIGQKALEVGLVDGISTLDDLITGLQSKIDKQNAGKETTMATKTSHILTQAQKAAMMEGVPLEVALTITDNASEETAELSQEATAALQTETTESQSALQAETDPSPANMESDLVAYLRTELASKTAEVVQLTTQLNKSETNVAALSAVHDSMKKIVATSVGRMQVGLGAPFMDLSDLPAEAVLQQHAKVSTLFANKFPVGGVAALSADEQLNTAHETPSVMEQAKLRQNQI